MSWRLTFSHTRTTLCTNIYSSFVHYCQKLEARNMSLSRCMVKKNFAISTQENIIIILILSLIYTREYYSVIKRKWAIKPCRDGGTLNATLLNEKSWSEKAVYYVISNTWRSRKGMEKAMAPHSSTLAWKIPWTEESGRLQSMGSLGVRHDCITFK